MTGYLYGGKDQGPTARTMGLGSIEWVAQPSFCEMKACPNFASWRIKYGSQSVEFCARHTLSTMRKQRLWARR